MFLVKVVATNAYVTKFLGRKIKLYIVQLKCIIGPNHRIYQVGEAKLATILLLFQKGALYCIISNNNNNKKKA